MFVTTTILYSVNVGMRIALSIIVIICVKELDMRVYDMTTKLREEIMNDKTLSPQERAYYLEEDGWGNPICDGDPAWCGRINYCRLVEDCMDEALQDEF